jgi:DNA-binding SARP family transcriptional activator
MSLLWVPPAGASYVKRSGVDAIARSYRISITNPENGSALPDILNVTSATLDTTSPINKNLHAANGQIFLSLQMNSGPVQRNNGDPLMGEYFSGMTPLPASALRYVAASGRSYGATRIHEVNQTNNPNSATDDGMVDATYYFTVPITNRLGTFIILPTRTSGVEYTGFTGFATTELNIGGPTRIALRFPKNLTAIEQVPKQSPPIPGKVSASGFNAFATMLAALLVFVGIFMRRRKTRKIRAASFVDANSPRAPRTTDKTENQEPAPPPTRVVHFAKTINDQETTLRVDVLGRLNISPVFAPASDPVRAIVAYLAMSGERLLTLDEIQTAIWPLTDAGTDIKKPAMRNYMVDARRTVGERHLPTASGRAGYQLKHFDTDWSEFQSLLIQATKVPKSQSTELRRQALNLSKGLPFSADTSRYFTWTFTSSVVYKVVDAVTTLAHELGTELVLTGDIVGAQAVLRQGLLTDPASLRLWEDLTDVLLESADQSGLELHWKTANMVLRTDDVVLLRNRANG